MRGKVLGYDASQMSGVIVNDEDMRYEFVKSEWKSDTLPRAGLEVNFLVEDNKATAIYVTTTSIGASITNAVGDSKKIPAALLAFFLGVFGVHKFYLGYTKEGLIMLLVFLFGFILLGLPSFIIAVIAFIEFIIYLTRSDEEFDRNYVKNKKGWF